MDLYSTVATVGMDIVLPLLTWDIKTYHTIKALLVSEYYRIMGDRQHFRLIILGSVCYQTSKNLDRNTCQPIHKPLTRQTKILSCI